MSMVNCRYWFNDEQVYSYFISENKVDRGWFISSGNALLYSSDPPEWSTGFVTGNGIRLCEGEVYSILPRKKYLPDGMQYELYNHLIYDNRDTRYIRETAKKYYSTPPNEKRH